MPTLGAKKRRYACRMTNARVSSDALFGDSLPDAHRVQSPPPRQRGGSPFFQQTSSMARVITETKAMNSAGRAFPCKKRIPNAKETKYAANTIHPCQHVGKPHPHPNRFAGNQYFSRGGFMRESLPKMSHGRLGRNS